METGTKTPNKLESASNKNAPRGEQCKGPKLRTKSGLCTTIGPTYTSQDMHQKKAEAWRPCQGGDRPQGAAAPENLQKLAPFLWRFAPTLVRRLHVVQTLISRQKAPEEGEPPILPTFTLFKERHSPLVTTHIHTTTLSP